MRVKRYLLESEVDEPLAFPQSSVLQSPVEHTCNYTGIWPVKLPV